MSLPVASPQDDLRSPEDFARDVLAQLMQSALANLKMMDTVGVKAEILSEIQRIVSQDNATKSVFREIDGFLVLMSVLSTIQDRSPQPQRPESKSRERKNA